MGNIPIVLVGLINAFDNPITRLFLYHMKQVIIKDVLKDLNGAKRRPDALCTITPVEFLLIERREAFGCINGEENKKADRMKFYCLQFHNSPKYSIPPC